MAMMSWLSQSAGFEEPETRTVYDREGKSVTLTDGDRIGKGGESVVYSVPVCANVLAKIWRKEVLDDPIKIGEARKRLCQMLNMDGLKRLPYLAWPQDAVYTKAKKLKEIGYVMRRMKGGASLYSLFCGDAGVISAFPKCANRRFLVKTALAYVQEILEMQDLGVSPCDFNPKNVMVAEKNGEPLVQFIDTDSFQFRGPDGIVRFSPAHVKAYLAPELFAPGALEKPRSNSSMEFSTALIVFAILTMGQSPYSYVSASDGSVMGSAEENLRKGLCGLGGNRPDVKISPALWLQFKQMPFLLKRLFIKWFNEGHSNCNARPTLKDLKRELDGYLFTLDEDKSRLPLIPNAVEHRDWLKKAPPPRSSGSNYGPRPNYGAWNGGSRNGFRPYGGPHYGYRPGGGPGNGGQRNGPRQYGGHGNGGSYNRRPSSGGYNNYSQY